MDLISPENERNDETNDSSSKVIKIDSNLASLTKHGKSLPILRTQGLCCHFDRFRALSDLNIEINNGTIVVVLGRNGAGKSTFINCVSGFAGTKTGKVIFMDQDITHEHSWRISQLGLARTFQVPKPISGLTIFSYVTLAALSGGVTHLNRKSAITLAEEVLEISGLLHKADKRPTELSTAQLRRLELARALALRPKLMLLDEPLGGLSPPQVEEYLTIIGRLRDSGITIVAIEHSVKAALEIADSVIFLDRGSLVKQGPPREVLSDKAVIDTYLGTRYVSRGFI